MNTVDKFISNLLENPIYYGILALFLSIYGPRLHPKLPPVIKDLFNNSVFRFVIIALIAYISSEDLTISLILSIAFLLFNGIIGNQQVLDKVKEDKPDGFSNFNIVTDTLNHDKQKGPEIKNKRSDIKKVKSIEKKNHKKLVENFASTQINSLSNENLNNFDKFVGKHRQHKYAKQQFLKKREKIMEKTKENIEQFRPGNVLNFDKLSKKIETFVSSNDQNTNPFSNLSGGVREAVPGEKYEGQWVDGVMHGDGTYTYADGSRYNGDWKDGKPDGKGVMVFGKDNQDSDTSNNAEQTVNESGELQNLDFGPVDVTSSVEPTELVNNTLYSEVDDISGLADSTNILNNNDILGSENTIEDMLENTISPELATQAVESVFNDNTGSPEFSTQAVESIFNDDTGSPEDSTQVMAVEDDSVALDSSPVESDTTDLTISPTGVDTFTNYVDVANHYKFGMF